ncbi:MAG: hypothetical protein ACYC3I_02825 [Gemmataceae bacterium]
MNTTTMSAEQQNDEVVLRFRPLRDAVAWPHRVRRLLKYALRVCNLRCIRVEGLPPLEEPAQTEDEKSSANVEQGSKKL